MQTYSENKTMDNAAQPDIEALRAQAVRLGADQDRLERELHAAQIDLATSEAAISEAMRASSKGAASGSTLTSGMLAQGAAQRKIIAAIEELESIRPQLAEANQALREAEARLDQQEASAVEREIVEELQIFAAGMVTYSRQCQAMEKLRERARQVNPKLLTPSVLEALGASWGEIHHSGSVEDRLALISKCAALPEEPATILRTKALEKALASKGEAERARKSELEHAALKKRGKILTGQPFTTRYEEGRGVICEKVID